MCGNILLDVRITGLQIELGEEPTAVPTALPVAQSAMNVSVCLRIIASLSLGRGSLCMMCSMKSLGMTEAMFHLSFPSTTSSQSCKDNDQRKQKVLVSLRLEAVLRGLLCASAALRSRARRENCPL